MGPLGSSASSLRPRDCKPEHGVRTSLRTSRHERPPVALGASRMGILGFPQLESTTYGQTTQDMGVIQGSKSEACACVGIFCLLFQNQMHGNPDVAAANVSQHAGRGTGLRPNLNLTFDEKLQWQSGLAPVPRRGCAVLDRQSPRFAVKHRSRHSRRCAMIRTCQRQDETASPDSVWSHHGHEDRPAGGHPVSEWRSRTGRAICRCGRVGGRGLCPLPLAGTQAYEYRQHTAQCWTRTRGVAVVARASQPAAPQW